MESESSAPAPAGADESGGLILTQMSQLCTDPDTLYDDTDSDQDGGVDTLAFYPRSGQVFLQFAAINTHQNTTAPFVMLSAGSPSSPQADHHLSQQDRGAAEIDYCDQEPGAMMICP
jgi:hypothetical protein